MPEKIKNPTHRKMEETRPRDQPVPHKNIGELNHPGAERMNIGPKNNEVVRLRGDGVDYLVEGLLADVDLEVLVRGVDDGNRVIVVVETRHLAGVQNLLRVLLVAAIKPMEAIRDLAGRVEHKVGHEAPPNQTSERRSKVEGWGFRRQKLESLGGRSSTNWKGRRNAGRSTPKGVEKPEGRATWQATPKQPGRPHTHPASRSLPGGPGAQRGARI